MYFLSGSLFVQRSVTNLCNLGRQYYEEQFCEVILNLDQWFKSRCCLKDFLSRALAALRFGGATPFMQF